MWKAICLRFRITRAIAHHPMRKAGLVDCWKARGWPDMCHPTAADDFICK
jgi:hypothetical protein